MIVVLMSTWRAPIPGEKSFSDGLAIKDSPANPIRFQEGAARVYRLWLMMSSYEQLKALSPNQSDGDLITLAENFENQTFQRSLNADSYFKLIKSKIKQLQIKRLKTASNSSTDTPRTCPCVVVMLVAMQPINMPTPPQRSLVRQSTSDTASTEGDRPALNVSRVVCI
jgi:hypothetical protein